MSPRRSTAELWAEARLRQLHRLGVTVNLRRGSSRQGYIADNGEGAWFVRPTAARAIDGLWFYEQERRLRNPPSGPSAPLEAWRDAVRAARRYPAGGRAPRTR